MKSKTTPTSKNTSEAIERVKLDLLSLVSHELRTPLTSVINSLRLMREEKLSSAEREKFLDMATRNAERLNHTLNQLLDLSKLVSGRLVCRFHEVALDAVLRPRFKAFQAEASRRGFKVKASLGRAELPVVLGDAPRLEKVLGSLFENALAFAPPATELRVSLKLEVARDSLPAGMRLGLAEGASEFVVVELSNAVAKGTVRTTAKDIFKIFSQQEQILDRVHEGVGGSLALGAEVLRQHGGALFAAASDDRFTVWMALPVLKSEEALMKVLESRLYALHTEVGAVSVVILRTDAKLVKATHEALKQALFRVSDTVYSLPDRSEVVVLMDDCKKSDALKIFRRLIENLGPEGDRLLKGARVGVATCPEDGTEPGRLLDFARDSLRAIPIKKTEDR